MDLFELDFDQPLVKAKNPKLRVWSDQQKAIFEEVKSGKRNITVRARAGCGKTSTLIESLKHAPENKILLAAFGKSIADELKERLFKGEARTLHSLGGAMIGRRRRYKIEKSCGYERAEIVVKDWAKKNSDDVEACRWIKAETWSIKKMVEVVKNTHPFATSIHDVEEAAFGMGLLGIFPRRRDKDKVLYDRNGFVKGRIEWPSIKDIVFRLVLDVLENQVMEAIEGRGNINIDFDDMIWLPVRLNWMDKDFELVALDEAQDVNACQIELAMGVCSGRMMIIGDEAQAIYLFRGADTDGMNRMTRQLNAIELGLTTTYRCPKVVVEEANRWVKDFFCAETAPDGVKEKIYQDEMVALAEEGDFILSRNNSPLIGVCLALIRAKKRAKVRGKSIGETLVKILKRVEGRNKFSDGQEMWVRLKKWKDDEVKDIESAVRRKFTKAKEKRILKEIADRVELIEDYLGIFHVLITEMKYPAKVRKQLDELFTDDDRRDYVICSSVHKAKGLEADRVFVLQWTLKNSPQEEANISYVACTRAKKSLYLVQKVRPGGIDPQAEEDDGWRIRSGDENDDYEEWKKEWAEGLDI